MARMRWLAAALLLAACGGTAPPSGGSGSNGKPIRPSDPKAAVLTAYTLVQGQPFRATFSLQLTMKVSGPAAALMGSMSGGIESSDAATITFASPTRNEMKESISDGGAPELDDVIVYDGTVYHSANGGATYDSFVMGPKDGGHYGAGMLITLLSDVTTASDGGEDTAPDGSIIEDYDCTLDPTKVEDLLGEAGPRFLGDAQLTPQMRRFFASIHVSSSSFSVGIERSGHPVTESLSISSSGDLGTIDPAFKGTAFTLTISGSGEFDDYRGTDIAITPPSGAQAIPGTPPPYV